MNTCAGPSGSFSVFTTPTTNRELKKARPVSELEAQGLTREEIDQRRLAYVAEVAVNWSPDLGTVLANEEVEEWKAKGHHVERRPLRQWDAAHHGLCRTPD